MAAPDTSPEPAMALREAFGDRKPPDISRKITACVACRKQKIKCHMTDSKPPCVRCKKRGLPCTVNRSLQMLLESDVTWKHEMESKMAGLEEAISKIANKISYPDLLSSAQGSSRDSTMTAELVVSPAENPNRPSHQPQQAWEVVLDPKMGPAAIPASCVSEVSSSTDKNGQTYADRYGSDIISRGLISLAKAEQFFAMYNQRLDHFLYRILGDHNSLASVRTASSLLTAAICAVGALHSASSDFQTCYKEFVNQASCEMFSKKHTVDDVRALCIGAFWLSDVSWTLVGAAVRTATQINLHRIPSKTSQMTRDSYLRTRLWFLVYVCDHHFSVAYGRPPMTHEFSSLSSPRSFLDSEFATEDDARLVSQVEIWSVSSRVFDTFGIDTDTPIPERLLPQFRRLGIALDTWRADWNERFIVNNHVGNYPKKGVGLHFNFAKLYLCSHVFRGVSQSEPAPYENSPEMEEFANNAVHCAASILRVIVADNEIQSYLDGLPTYFDTMIAFAVVFLLKVTTKNFNSVRIDKPDILRLLDQLTTVLKNVTSRMHPQHLLSNIANSIGKLLDRSRQPNIQQPSTETHNRQNTGFAATPAMRDWIMSPSDSMFLENYDFLYQQDQDFNFDFLEFDQAAQNM